MVDSEEEKRRVGCHHYGGCAAEESEEVTDDAPCYNKLQCNSGLFFRLPPSSLEKKVYSHH